METGKRDQVEYRCNKCGTVSKHKRLKTPRALCPKCKKMTWQRPVSPLPTAPASRELIKPEPTKTAEVKTGVAVVHEPETVPAPETKEPEESTGLEGAGVGEMLSAEDWADLYGMPAEALTMAMNRPDLNIPDDRCQAQGARLYRFCVRHNIRLPPYLDIVPLAASAIGDYGRLARGLAEEFKKTHPTKTKAEAEKSAPAAGDVKVPESKVETTATATSEEIPSDIDERIKKALSGGGKRKGET